MRFGPAIALADLLGDYVTYRNLRLLDPMITWQPPARLPRKVEPAYGQVVVDLLTAIQSVAHPGTPLTRILVIGDNRATDGVMFEHARCLLPASSHALIVDETGAPQACSPEQAGISHADGWPMVDRWSRRLADQGVTIDCTTAVLLDVDKTLLGPRGRNSGVIDLTRGMAMASTIKALVGQAWNQARFDDALSAFNRPALHHFTGDNQDFVALLCLLVVAGGWDRAVLAAEIASGKTGGPAALIQRALQHHHLQPIWPALSEMADRVAAGDPTPFKRFREYEYRLTVERMNVGGELSAPDRLQTELCICGEVYSAAQHWQRAGALIVALSDKPDEAALPSPELAAAGYQPLHHVKTHIVTADDCMA
ncbi:MAG: hypothetical protein NVSMB42_16630 [Herpetosiphon sp.]